MTSESDRVLTILRHAHRRMDGLGYPPVASTIDGRQSPSAHGPSGRIGAQTEDRVTALVTPPVLLEAQGAPYA